MIYNFLTNFSIIFSAYCTIRTYYNVCFITIKDSLLIINSLYTIHNCRYDSSYNILSRMKKNCVICNQGDCSIETT